MGKLTLYGYGRDLGPWNDLKALGAYAARPGSVWEAKIIGNQPLGVPPEEFLRPRPHVLVIGGPASFKSEEELALLELAGERGIPAVVLADTHGSFARPPAKGRVGQVVAIVASARETTAAEEFGYKAAAHLGGPPAWQDWWGLRQRHPKRLDERFTVYVGGFKSPALTEEFLSVIAEGTRRAKIYTRAMIFRMHPNEDGKPPKEAGEEATRVWQEKRDSAYRSIMAGISVIEAPSSDAALAGADISFFSSGATSTIQASMNRIVCGYYESPTIRERMVAQSGKETWWPAEPEIGAVVKVTSADEVADLICKVYDDSAEFLVALKRRQEAAYPEPEQPSPRVEGRILDFLCGMALAV